MRDETREAVHYYDAYTGFPMPQVTGDRAHVTNYNRWRSRDFDVIFGNAAYNPSPSVTLPAVENARWEQLLCAQSRCATVIFWYSIITSCALRYYCDVASCTSTSYFFGKISIYRKRLVPDECPEIYLTTWIRVDRGAESCARTV